MIGPELAALLRAARVKAGRELPSSELHPGTVLQVVSDDAIAVPYAKVQVDAPTGRSPRILDVPIVGAVPDVAARVMVRFDPPHGATLAGPVIPPVPVPPPSGGFPPWVELIGNQTVNAGGTALVATADSGSPGMAPFVVAAGSAFSCVADCSVLATIDVAYDQWYSVRIWRTLMYQSGSDSTFIMLSDSWGGPNDSGPAAKAVSIDALAVDYPGYVATFSPDWPTDLGISDYPTGGYSGSKVMRLQAGDTVQAAITAGGWSGPLPNPQSLQFTMSLILLEPAVVVGGG